MSNRQSLTLDAQRKGFTVFEEEGLWWVGVPARPRQPSNTQGSYVSAERAWMGAALLSSQWQN